MKKEQFGIVIDATREDFLEKLEVDGQRTIVVVHLFEPSLHCCNSMNRILEELAADAAYLHVKFIRMEASANGLEVDRLTLPILQLYRGGAVATTLAGIAHELGDSFTKDDIDWLLQSSELF